MNPDIRVSLTRRRRVFFHSRRWPSSLLVVNADGPETRVALVEDGLLARALHRAQARARDRRKHLQGPGRTRAPRHAGRLRQHRSREVGVHPRLGRARYARRSQAPDDRGRRAAATATTTTSRRASPTARASRTCSRKGRRSSSRSPRSPSAPRAPGPPATSRCPGRHLVFMPTVDHIGISRRISSDKERAGCATSSSRCARPARASSCARWPRGSPRRTSRADMAFLIKLWNEVVAKTETARCPVAHLQRSRPAAAHGARPLHRRRREADHRLARRVRPHQEVHRGVHARLRRADRAVRRRPSPSSTATASRSRSTARSSARSGSSRAAT